MMKLIESLQTEIKNWDKAEGAGAVYFMYGRGKKPINSSEENDIKNEEDKKDDKEYRDKTQGDRNSKYLMKARIHADTPQARLKKQRTEYEKEHNRI